MVMASGEILARLRKRYVHNIIRKRWYVETPAGQVVALAIEESIVLSLLRRVLGSFFGLLRTNFVFTHTDGTVLGEFNRKFTILDRTSSTSRAIPSAPRPPRRPRSSHHARHGEGR